MSRKLVGRDGASTPKPALTTNDKGVSEMANYFNNNKNEKGKSESIMCDNVEAKIIQSSGEKLQETFFCDYYEFSRNLINVISPIEKAFICAFYANNYKGDSAWHSKSYCLDNADNKISDIIKSHKKIKLFLNKTTENIDDTHMADYYRHVLSDQLIIYNQVWILNWPVDFMFAKQNWKTLDYEYLVVECDGHDYHERTKEQAKKDRSRDRDLQSNGYTVFRFTGSEIWKDPNACAEQVADWAGM